MRKICLLVWAAAALCIPVYSAPQPVVLVRDGKPLSSICIARDASPSEKRAAEELQRFLQEMSGARLPIQTDTAAVRGNLILIGRSRITDGLKLKIPFDTLGPEGFVLRTSGRHLVIAGGRQRGTMYGVYTFLEKLGCRWFTPQVSRIPKMATIAVGRLDETGKPAFEFREPFENRDKDWNARNRMNGAHNLLDASTGGKIEYYPFVHSFYQMIPPEKYFKEHPEYFSLIDGKRRVGRGQLCLTNPDVLRLSIEAVSEWIRQHPEATIYSVSQNDWEGWCECDRCRRVEQEEGGAHSGPILRFVNAVAAEVEKKYPGKLIDTLAYAYSETPPLKVRPRPNVRIRLCAIGACEAHLYEKCPYNANFMNNLRAWSKITDQLYVWHYATNYSHWLLPFPDFDELAADIPMYRRYGVRGLFLQGVYEGVGGGENRELRAYVMAQLLWNPASDVGKAIDEFHKAFYGKAAKPMREYFDLLHGPVRMPPEGEGQHLFIRRAPEFSERDLAKAVELFRRADAAAESEPVRMRVRKARLAIDEVELQRSKRFVVRDGWYVPVGWAGLTERFETFIANLRLFGITSLAEGHTLADYEQEFATHVKPYRVVTLENASLRVNVVPELNGRVIQMIDKKSGHDALRRPDSDELLYPERGGLSVSVSAGAHATPWQVKWQPDSTSGGRELVLTGVSTNGLRLRRRIFLSGEDSILKTDTTVENTGVTPRDIALRSYLIFNPEKDKLDVATKFTKQDGTAVESEILAPELPFQGSASYSGADRPDGEWRLINRALGLALVARFPKNQVERCTLSWLARGENSVTESLWSNQKTLQPGERLRLKADYGIE